VGGVTIAVALIDARNQLLREDPQFGAQLEEDETGQLEGQLRAQILNQLVLQELVLQGAASDGIEVTDDDVAAERAVLVEEFGDEETLQAQLAAAGLPEDQLDMEIRASLAIDRVTEQLLADAGDLDPEDQEARFAVQEQWLRSVADDVEVVVDTAFGAWSPEQLAVVPA
jgi:FKBP-type peptidyl-prolyl cis-trans isomerase (trigger factor)